MYFLSVAEVKRPETEVKVEYAMGIVCCLARYVLAITCRQERLTSHQAATVFLHYCTFFTEMPREILSDNPSVITSTFFDALCGLAGSTRDTSIVYGPESNGRADWAVQSIINALRLDFCSGTFCIP